MTQQIRDASIVIKNAKEPPLTLTIHLTSPVVREEIEKAAAGGKLWREDLWCLFSGIPPPAGSRADEQTAEILFIGPSMELGDKTALSQNETMLCL